MPDSRKKVEFVFDERSLMPLPDPGDGWDVIQVRDRKLLIPRHPGLLSESTAPPTATSPSPQIVQHKKKAESDAG